MNINLLHGIALAMIENIIDQRPWSDLNLFISDVKDISFDMDNKKVYVTSDASADDLLAVIKKTGKKASYIGTAWYWK